MRHAIAAACSRLGVVMAERATELEQAVKVGDGNAGRLGDGVDPDAASVEHAERAAAQDDTQRGNPHRPDNTPRAEIAKGLGDYPILDGQPTKLIRPRPRSGANSADERQ